MRLWRISWYLSAETLELGVEHSLLNIFQSHGELWSDNAIAVLNSDSQEVLGRKAYAYTPISILIVENDLIMVLAYLVVKLIWEPQLGLMPAQLNFGIKWKMLCQFPLYAKERYHLFLAIWLVLVYMCVSTRMKFL